MITKVNNHSPFTVKKSELKSGASWNQVAQERFTKQHPHEIGEGDSHAVPVFEDGPSIPKPSEEELHVAVSSLEDQISKLKEADRSRPAPEKPVTAKPQVKDDFYDDWLNE